MIVVVPAALSAASHCAIERKVRARNGMQELRIDKDS